LIDSISPHRRLRLRHVRELFAGSGETTCDVALVGLPWDGGASLGAPGGRYGPDAVRRTLGWWLDRIRDERVWHVDADAVVDLSGLRLVDLGDVELSHDVDITFARAVEMIGEALADGRTPIVIGGDHSITIPAIHALARRHDRIGVVQLDAHLDLVDESPLQGRLSQSSPMRRALDHAAASPRRLVQIGLRSFNYPD
jgi:formiminoglutamase/agmatinase